MFKERLKFILLILALFSIFVFLPHTSGQFQLYLSPLLVELDLAPGATKTFKLHVKNENKLSSITLRAYSSDMRESQKGNYEVIEKGVSEFSCADWMEVIDTSFTLEPGVHKEVEVKVKVPRNVFGGRYAAVVFEIVPEEGAYIRDSYGAFRLHYRMPSFVELTIKRFGGLVRKAEITDFRVEPVTHEEVKKELGEDALSFTASVKNEGNIHVVGKGFLYIKDKEGKTKRRVPLGGGRGVVIPGAAVDFTSYLKKPLPGEYLAKTVINFGGLSPMVAEVPFTISRTTTSALGSFKASSFIALDLNPEEVEMKIPPKGFRAVTFSFRNDEKDTLKIKANVKDMQYDETGDLVVLDSSETGHSCSDWIGLEPQEFSIPPGKRERVKLTLQAPTQGEGGYYACVVFETLLKTAKEGVISTPFQIPVVLSIPQNLEMKGEVIHLDVSAIPGKPAFFTTYFKNTGNIHLKPRGKITLEFLRELGRRDDIVFMGEPKYEKLADVDLGEVEEYILPEGIRKMDAIFPGALDAGKYMALITVDYGGAEPATFSKEFTVK